MLTRVTTQLVERPVLVLSTVKLAQPFVDVTAATDEGTDTHGRNQIITQAHDTHGRNKIITQASDTHGGSKIITQACDTADAADSKILNQPVSFKSNQNHPIRISKFCRSLH